MSDEKPDVPKVDPFLLGETKITEVSVKPLNFIKFANTVDNDLAVQTRKRIIATTSLNKKPVEEADMEAMPIKAVRQIMAVLDYTAQTPIGKLLSSESANGVDAPILYKLGTPFRFKNGKGEATEITELEFSAIYFRDVDSIISKVQRSERVLEMLRRIAAPVGGTAKFQTLPEAALDQLTISDGLFLAANVLDNFTV